VAHEYGTKSRLWRAGNWVLGLAAATTLAGATVPSVEWGPSASPQHTKLCVGGGHATLDGWDERFVDLLDLLFGIFGIPNGIQTSAHVQPEDAAEAFLSLVQSPELPAGTSLAALEAGQLYAAEARLINATQGVLPPALALDVEARLVEVEAALALAVQAELEVQRPW